MASLDATARSRDNDSGGGLAAAGGTADDGSRGSGRMAASAAAATSTTATTATTPGDPFALVGTTIAQKYVIESVAGEGGYSVVYRAMHLVWRRPVAIKAFKCFGATPEDDQSGFLEAFLREGALLSELSERTSAICQSRDVGTLMTPNGEWVPFLVLEWVDGETLEAILQRERHDGMAARSLGDSMRLIAPIADALAQAHERGVVHRDVKPANVLVVCEHPTPAVKLLDFGIAKVLQSRASRISLPVNSSREMQMPLSAVQSFTPAYGAPEQFLPTYGATGPWTDVFALALLLVELVSGKAALEGNEVAPLTLSATDKLVRPTPRARGVRIGDAVEEVFAKALAVLPSQRYASVGEFWSALEAAVNEERRRAMMTTAPQTREVSQVSLAPYAVAAHAHAKVLARQKKATPAWALLLIGAVLGAGATSRVGQTAFAMPLHAAEAAMARNDASTRASGTTNASPVQLTSAVVSTASMAAPVVAAPAVAPDASDFRFSDRNGRGASTDFGN